MTIAIILIAAALLGVFLWKKFLSPEAKLKALADDIRSTGGTIPDAAHNPAGGGGANAGDATKAIGDALANGIGAQQTRVEERTAILTADVTNQLVAQINEGKFFKTTVALPSHLANIDEVRGSRDVPMLVRRVRTGTQSLSEAITAALDPAYGGLGILAVGDWQVGQSPDVWLTANVIPLKFLYNGGLGDGLFSFTSSTVVSLVDMQDPTQPYPNTVTLSAAYDAKYPSSAAPTVRVVTTRVAGAPAVRTTVEGSHLVITTADTYHATRKV